MSVQWTSKGPTSEGFYIWRDGRTWALIWVWADPETAGLKHSEFHCYHPLSDAIVNTDTMRCEWSDGPIAEPDDTQVCPNCASIVEATAGPRTFERSFRCPCGVTTSERHS